MIRLSENDVPIAKLSKWMGHRNIAVTLLYYAEYINDDLLQAAGADRPVASVPTADNVVAMTRNA